MKDGWIDGMKLKNFLRRTVKYGNFHVRVTFIISNLYHGLVIKLWLKGFLDCFFAHFIIDKLMTNPCCKLEVMKASYPHIMKVTLFDGTTLAKWTKERSSSRLRSWEVLFVSTLP